MGLSPVSSIYSSINYPRYTRVVNGSVVFAKENIWLNGHKVRIGGSFSDTARVLNRYSAKTGVKAEVVCNNNVARLKLIVRGRNLTINDPKGVFRSLQIGKNIGASDKMLVQIICKGKVNLSYSHPVRSLTVPGLVSENNNKILNKLRQTIHQVHYQEEVLDDLAEDSDDDQQILAHEFATDPSSPPSLLLGSNRRYMVVDSSIPSLPAEGSDDQIDSGDEQIIGGDFINPSSSRSRLFGSGPRYSFIDQPIPSSQPVPSLLEGMEIDPPMLSSKTMPSSLSELEADQSMPGLGVTRTPMRKSDPITILPRLMPGSRWSIQSMPSFQPGPSLLDDMEIDDPPILSSKTMPSFQSELRSPDYMEIDDPDPPPLSEDSQLDGEDDHDVAQLTPQKSSSVVGASQSAPSRMAPESRHKLPGVTPPVSKRSRSIERRLPVAPATRRSKSAVGRGAAIRAFVEKLNFVIAHKSELRSISGINPKIYSIIEKSKFTEEERSAIISTYEAIPKLPREKSSAAASASPPPVRRSKSVGRGDGDARRDFTTALSYCKRHDPDNQLYFKISYGKADKVKIMEIYEGLKSSGAISPPVPFMIPLAYSSRSLSSKQDSSSSIGVDVVT